MSGKEYRKSPHSEVLSNTYVYETTYKLDNDYDSRTIYVAMPSYRDPELLDTIESIFLNAKNPDRIFIGASILYNKTLDDKWWKPLEKYPNVKIKIEEATEENTGIGKQRSTAASFYNEETYYFQTDCHMRFDPNWDA